MIIKIVLAFSKAIRFTNQTSIGKSFLSSYLNLKSALKSVSVRKFLVYTAKTGVLNLTPVGINRGPHPQVLTLHPRVST